MKKFFISIILLLLLIGCSNDDSISVDDSFHAIPEQYPYDNLSPASQADYLELIQGSGEYEHTLYQFGELCIGAGNVEDCTEILRRLIPKMGLSLVVFLPPVTIT
ncbi:hypothetical protein [Autumnicola musiva]|uniref:Uncharacterized protein n=1 Tax=Autumnicola musiva TaxID=3075589 RepID=A0ABU3D793_9FLAO|nr:hypothetical protein [Zunongwangia sp. F117]MDT0677400.1 hypothetical protein [Zunongwangia sp. F117]